MHKSILCDQCTTNNQSTFVFNSHKAMHSVHMASSLRIRMRASSEYEEVLYNCTGRNILPVVGLHIENPSRENTRQAHNTQQIGAPSNGIGPCTICALYSSTWNRQKKVMQLRVIACDHAYMLPCNATQLAHLVTVAGGWWLAVGGLKPGWVTTAQTW